eukprot:GHVN01071185.1.p1 GENE.GHVN01071185.1~~GHVN01071185.1.p1  ORF type:complete len:1052 (-),score=330.36 GHVN01071185.1:17-2947(-)
MGAGVTSDSDGVILSPDLPKRAVIVREESVFTPRLIVTQPTLIQRPTLCDGESEGDSSKESLPQVVKDAMAREREGGDQEAPPDASKQSRALFGETVELTGSPSEVSDYTHRSNYARQNEARMTDELTKTVNHIRNSSKGSNVLMGVNRDEKDTGIEDIIDTGHRQVIPALKLDPNETSADSSVESMNSRVMIHLAVGDDGTGRVGGRGGETHRTIEADSDGGLPMGSPENRQWAEAYSMMRLNFPTESVASEKGHSFPSDRGEVDRVSEVSGRSQVEVRNQAAIYHGSEEVASGRDERDVSYPPADTPSPSSLIGDPTPSDPSIDDLSGPTGLYSRSRPKIGTSTGNYDFDASSPSETLWEKFKTKNEQPPDARASSTGPPLINQYSSREIELYGKELTASGTDTGTGTGMDEIGETHKDKDTNSQTLAADDPNNSNNIHLRINSSDSFKSGLSARSADGSHSSILLPPSPRFGSRKSSSENCDDSSHNNNYEHYSDKLIVTTHHATHHGQQPSSSLLTPHLLERRDDDERGDDERDEDERGNDERGDDERGDDERGDDEDMLGGCDFNTERVLDEFDSFARTAEAVVTTSPKPQSRSPEFFLHHSPEFSSRSPQIAPHSPNHSTPLSPNDAHRGSPSSDQGRNSPPGQPGRSYERGLSVMSTRSTGGGGVGPNIHLCSLFEDLTSEETGMVMGGLEICWPNPNQILFEANSVVDNLFVVERGTVSAHHSSPSPHSTNLTHTYREGDFIMVSEFAQRALSEVTLTANKGCALWKLSADAYDAAMKDVSRARAERLSEYLTKVKVLANLNRAEIQELSYTMRRKRFLAGEVVVHEGETTSELLVVEQGSLIPSQDSNRSGSPNTSPHSPDSLGVGEHLNDTMLLFPRMNMKTFVAGNVDGCLVAFLSHQHLRSIVGDPQAILTRGRTGSSSSHSEAGSAHQSKQGSEVIEKGRRKKSSFNPRKLAGKLTKSKKDKR